MPNKGQFSRRKFIAAVAATGAVSAAPQGQSAPAENAVENPATAKRQAAPDIVFPRVFSGRHLGAIAFPLGGVCSGSISLGGRGELRDWEIFNRPDKGNGPSYAFPAIWARTGNRK